jgi:hypothetical protein
VADRETAAEALRLLRLIEVEEVVLRAATGAVGDGSV